jgi:hypothetical protein
MKVFKMLLDKNADVKKTSKHNLTALHFGNEENFNLLSL